MSDTALIDTIDKVYEAVVDRSQWPAFLRRATDLMAANTCILASTGLSEDVVTLNSSSPHPLWDQIADLGEAHTIRRVDHLTHGDNPFAAIFPERTQAQYRSGLLAGTTTMGGMAALFLRRETRSFSEEEERTLRRLWPHIVRARTLQAASDDADLARSVSCAVDILDYWHVAAFVFSAAGRQVFTNRAAKRLTELADGLSLAPDGPLAATPRETRALRETMRAVAQRTSTGSAALRLARLSGARPYEVALYRIASALTPDSLVAMFVAAADSSIRIDPSVLRTLHGLTELESEVANCLVYGMHVREMAPALGLSLQTARWYVQQVRQKLDATSQNDVVRFLIRGVTGIDAFADTQSAKKEN
jgi:DNA-binding CsgD family transcriptional regulator